MHNTTVNKRISIPNMLLIAGNGRNVGKTTLACKIIAYFSEKHEVNAVKISPHFHAFNEGEVLFKSLEFVIYRENKLTGKDSSRMLRAGAKNVYYVTAQQNQLNEVLNALLPLINNGLTIVESGGLNEFVEPGLFFFVNYKKKKITKPHLLEYHPKYVENDGENFDINPEQLIFSNNRIQYAHE